MKNSLFFNSIWVILVLMVSAFGFFKGHYNGTRELSLEVRKVSQQLKEAQLREVLAENANATFRQEVAQLLPELLEKTQWDTQRYAARNLASVVRAESLDKQILNLKHLNYERAKRFFRSGEYALAAELLDEIVREQPLGLDIVEAHFLLAECFYKLDSQREFVTVVNEMVDLFPESDLTGFILLRLGQIYIEQDRVEDAQEVYRVVLSTYQYRPLQIQAKKNLEVIRL